MNSKFGKWSKSYDFCTKCLKDSNRYMGKGLCKLCYQEQYRNNPKNQDRIKEAKLKHYINKVTPFVTKRRREEKNFGGNRELTLIRDRNRCVRCGSENKLTVHHKDRSGRGLKSGHNNDLSNLETLCRRCHISEHRKELLDARMNS